MYGPASFKSMQSSGEAASGGRARYATATSHPGDEKVNASDSRWACLSSTFETAEKLAKMRHISPARFIRQRLGVPLDAFADAYDIPADTLRAWERHLAEPTPVELAYLRAIQRFPERSAGRRLRLRGWLHWAPITTLKPPSSARRGSATSTHVPGPLRR